MKQELQDNLKNFVDTQHKHKNKYKGDFENINDLKLEFETKYIESVKETELLKKAHKRELENIEGIRN
jgi:hypothetical protein